MHWTNVVTAFEDPEIRAQWEDTKDEIKDIIDYVQAQTSRRASTPRDDLMTALIDAEVDGDQLDDIEIALFFILLMAAGNDSTRATYSAHDARASRESGPAPAAAR